MTLFLPLPIAAPADALRPRACIAAVQSRDPLYRYKQEEIAKFFCERAGAVPARTVRAIFEGSEIAERAFAVPLEDLLTLTPSEANTRQRKEADGAARRFAPVWPATRPPPPHSPSPWTSSPGTPRSGAGFHEEVDAVLGGRAPTAADMAALPYLTMVVKEAMRLYPSVPVVGRRAVADAEIDGVRIPAGADVLVSPWVTHRHPAYWTDPDRFDPERFMPEAEAARPRYAWFPFGGGPRAASAGTCRRWSRCWGWRCCSGPMTSRPPTRRTYRSARASL